MDPLLAIADLRIAARLLLESGDATGGRVAAGLTEYFAGANAGADLLVCLGLVGVNGEKWFQIEARETRDTALREMAARFYPDHRVAQVAYEIERLAERYAASAWRFDQAREEMPSNYAGTAKAHLWAAFTSGATMPLKRRQLQSILAPNSRSAAA